MSIYKKWKRSILFQEGRKSIFNSMAEPKTTYGYLGTEAVGLQNLLELLVPPNSNHAVQEGFDMNQNMEDLQVTEQVMDNGISIDAATRNEKEPSDEIRDLLSKAEALTDAKSKLIQEFDLISLEAIDEKKKLESAEKELAKFPSPDVEKDQQTLMAWLETELMQVQQARTSTQAHISYLKEQIKAKDSELTVLSRELQDLECAQSAEIAAAEVEASKQDEEIDSLRKTSNELNRMLENAKELDKGLKTRSLFEDKSLTKIRSIVAKMDSHCERFEVLSYVIPEVNKKLLKELSACEIELQMEKTKLQPLWVENKELMDENKEKALSILQRVVEPPPGLDGEVFSVAVENHRKRCAELLQTHKAAP